MTLTEIDTLKQEHPERFYEFYLWIMAKKKAELREIQKLKDQQGDTGEKDIGYIRE